MIKVGFIGCGNINRHHVRSINKGVENLIPVAGADISPDARTGFLEDAPDARLFDDYNDMLQTADIDAVCVGLPTALHKDATVAAARAGKHVFCEKPMAMTLADAETMIQETAKAGVKLMIGQVRRYDNHWGACRDLVRTGAIGRPVIWRHVAGGSAPGRPWFVDAQLGGGPFMDGAVHNWDFANYMFGSPTEAIGSIMRIGTGTALDTGGVVVRYADGDEVLLSWSWGLPTGCRADSAMDVLGPKGVIRFPGTFSDDEFEYDRDTQGAFLVDTGSDKRIATFTKNDMFADEWRDFRDSLVANRDPKVTGQIGMQALAVALAVLETGATRKPVPVELVASG